MKKLIKVFYKVIICIIMMLAIVSCNKAVSASINQDTTKAISNDTDKYNGKKVYFAAPLFSQSEKDFNLKIVNIIEEYGYKVFLPQRDGFLAVEMEGMSEEEKLKTIFEKDLNEVLKADILVMNIDGRVPDEGACVELGIAYANNKRCYGIKTDSRVVELDLGLNPMITGCFIKLFENYDGDKLIKSLREYLSNNEL